jgi:hypothetical protein
MEGILYLFMTSQLLRMVDLRCFVDKGQMMLKKIAKIKNFNNFMLWHLVDFKYGCGKCQTGSVVTVQIQFECGTIKIKFLVFCLKGVIPLKNSPHRGY